MKKFGEPTFEGAQITSYYSEGENRLSREDVIEETAALLEHEGDQRFLSGIEKRNQYCLAKAIITLKNVLKSHGFHPRSISGTSPIDQNIKQDAEMILSLFDEKK